MSPLRGGRVIPSGWSRHHAPTARGGMTGRCRIYNPDNDIRGFNPAAGVGTLTRGVPVYDGPCRIDGLPSASRTTIQADDAETAHRFLVQIDLDAPVIGAGWEVVLYAQADDALGLVDVTLTVTEDLLGTENFTRDLIAYLPAPEGVSS